MLKKLIKKKTIIKKMPIFFCIELNFIRIVDDFIRLDFL